MKEVCIHCGAPENSTIHMTNSRNTEIRISAHKFVAKPKVVCLCGSTRFYKQFVEANFTETMCGNVVLTVGFFANADPSDWQLKVHGETIGITPQDKIKLDELHKRKIDLADEILVLNVDGYIGESTRSEIDYAISCRKPVRYLEEKLENR